MVRADAAQALPTCRVQLEGPGPCDPGRNAAWRKRHARPGCVAHGRSREPTGSPSGRALSACVLRVRAVAKSFGEEGTDDHILAVDSVSFQIRPAETVGLIGESGSGKSTVGKLALGLLAPDAGTVEFLGRDLAGLSREQFRSTRAEASVVFQEPEESLNPRMKVFRIVEEPLVIHEPHLSTSERHARVEAAFADVNIGSELWQRRPRSLSGGQQQRIGIARAIVTRPQLIVLDEPTSSLDLSVQAQIINLLLRLQREHGFSYLFISHDLRVVSYVSHRILVMYSGRIVESGPRKDVVNRPLHPYTLVLLSSALSPDPEQPPVPILEREDTSSGHVDSEEGCTFLRRCPLLSDSRCATETPDLEEKTPGHAAATFCEVATADWDSIA